MRPGPSASDLAYGAHHADGKSPTPRGQRIGEGVGATEETRVDPVLEVNPRVGLPATAIGSSTSAEVTVRNPDKIAHTLDPTRPVTSDPFNDFVVRENSSRIIPPGESRNLTVDFKPSRRASAEQTFQVSTDKGAGPQAQVTFSGEGIESGGKTEDEREVLEKARIADQDFQREQIDAGRVTDPNRQKRVAAEHAVAEWKARAVEYNQSLADWTHENFERFLGKTGGDVHVAEPGRIAKFIKSKAVQTAVAVMMPEKEAEEQIAKHAAGKVGLKVYEKGVEKMSDWLWDQITGEKKAPSAEEAALQATENMADKSIAKGRDISRARDAANLVVSDSESAARMQISSANDVAQIDGVRSWAQSEHASIPKKLDPKDASLSEELLATWLRERAATPKKANEETNSTAWDKARGELAKSGKVPTLETPDLFIHQCRNEWSRIGAAQADIDAAVAELEQQRHAIEEEAVRGGITDPQAVATMISNGLGSANGPIVATFNRAQNPREMAAAFEPNQYQLGTDDGKDHFAGRFSLTCSLWLKTSGNGVYVDTFAYHDEKFLDFWRKP